MAWKKKPATAGKLFNIYTKSNLEKHPRTKYYLSQSIYKEFINSERLPKEKQQPHNYQVLYIKHQSTHPQTNLQKITLTQDDTNQKSPAYAQDEITK